MGFADFSLTNLYNDIITKLNTQLTAVAKLFKDQTTGDFADQVRYNSSTDRLEYWTGSAWAALPMTGTAAGTAATLATARTIGGVSFNGSANINLPGVNTTGNQNTTGNAATATLAANCTGNSGTATSASGPSFFTAEASGENAIGARCTGYPEAYIFNNYDSWGVYSSAGDTLCKHDRASGQNQFFGVLYGGLGVSTDLSGLTQFERSLGANGYQKLPGGLIIQWGQSYSASTGYVMISFPIAFPTAILNVQTTYNRSSYTDNYRGFHTPTTTGVYIGVDASTTNWFAIGY